MLPTSLAVERLSRDAVQAVTQVIIIAANNLSQIPGTAILSELVLRF